MDRRRAEAIALEFRRRVKELGFDGARVTVAPEVIRGDEGAGPA
jgi:hypothetical protein